MSEFDERDESGISWILSETSPHITRDMVLEVIDFWQEGVYFVENMVEKADNPDEIFKPTKRHPLRILVDEAAKKRLL